jgi:hypothetical protein
MRDYLDVVGVDGGFPLDRLGREVRGDGLELGVLTDEELVAMRIRRADGPVERYPHLAQLDLDERAVAVDTASRLMATTYGVVASDDGSGPRLAWVHAPIAGALAAAAVCVVQDSAAVDGAIAELIHVVSGELVLLEVVSHDGMHSFTFLSPKAAAEATAVESSRAEVVVQRYERAPGGWTATDSLAGGPLTPLSTRRVLDLFDTGAARA